MFSRLTPDVTLGRLAAMGLLVSRDAGKGSKGVSVAATACESGLDSASQQRAANARQSASELVSLAAIGRWTLSRADGSERELVTVGRSVIL